ncbi:thiol:disulfide interchange protein DsbA/DsbL [Pseudoduganella sp. UC29_71]|uniref:thiol:disulfide interchange protein DsbA/DsbL n=1 Tax=Pseudoduganella sp. UC29_71 TaxID=3350174 RepID=UPI00366B3CE3
MLTRTVLALSLALAAAVAVLPASASPAVPRDGAEYRTLPSPVAPQAQGKKVEVVEFFMYHCPACNMLEPGLAAWVRKQGDAIQFRRIHVPHTGAADPEAHLFLTLEAMKLDDSMHDKVLHTWHVERKRLKSDEDNLEWAVRNGLDKAQFTAAYTSFGVQTRLRNLEKLVGSYRVEGTPTVVINGRYLTSPSIVAESNPNLPRQSVEAAAFQVMDALVLKAQQELGR